MKHALAFLTVLILLQTGCGSTPKYPTERQWKRTPILKTDHKTLEVQGNFKNDIAKFLTAASRIKDGMTKEEVHALGFDPELAHQPCESVGWLETSQLVLGNAVINVASMEQAIENRRQYTAIRCRAKDTHIRTDRLLAYVHHKDQYGKGLDISLTIVFKSKRVTGVDMNKSPVRSHERQSAFMKVLGEIFGIPKIEFKNPSVGP